MYGTPSETVQIVDIILFLVLSYWYHFLTNSIYMLLTLKFKYKSWKVNSWNILLVKRYKNKYELVIANLFWFIFTTFIILWSIEQNSRHSGRVKKSSSCNTNIQISRKYVVVGINNFHGFWIFLRRNFWGRK